MPIMTKALLVTTTFLAGTPALHCSDDGDHHGGGGMGQDGGSSDGAAVCTPLLITDPAAPLDGYALFSPDEKRNNPNAGEPFYVFLAAGSEAVVIDGPPVASAPGLFTLANPGIALVGARETSADGYHVTVNPRLQYDVSIADFEAEVALARVELCEKDRTINSRFVFRGNPGASGVAFDITIVGTAGTTVSPPTDPVTVEVR